MVSARVLLKKLQIAVAALSGAAVLPPPDAVPQSGDGTPAQRIRTAVVRHARQRLHRRGGVLAAVGGPVVVPDGLPGGIVHPGRAVGHAPHQDRRRQRTGHAAVAGVAEIVVHRIQRAGMDAKTADHIAAEPATQGIGQGRPAAEPGQVHAGGIDAELGLQGGDELQHELLLMRPAGAAPVLEGTSGRLGIDEDGLPAGIGGGLLEGQAQAHPEAAATVTVKGDHQGEARRRPGRGPGQQVGAVDTAHVHGPGLGGVLRLCHRRHTQRQQGDQTGRSLPEAHRSSLPAGGHCPSIRDGRAKSATAPAQSAAAGATDRRRPVDCAGARRRTRPARAHRGWPAGPTPGRCRTLPPAHRPVAQGRVQALTRRSRPAPRAGCHGYDGADRRVHAR